MQRIPDPSMIKPLKELGSGVTVYDPKGRRGFTTVRKEGDQQYGIHLYGWNKTVLYDGDEKVEVIDYNLPKPL